MKRALAAAVLVACHRAPPPPPPLPEGSAPAPVTSQDVDAAPVLERGAPRRAERAPQTPRWAEKGYCPQLADGADGHVVAERDLRASYVDGNDLLALVNRSPLGQLAPGWAPADMVDLRTGEPATASGCEMTFCLRREAAAALGELMAEMKRRGFPGKVESAFRSHAGQCWTFLEWTKKGSFCGALEQSALPGHSQHQLGTAVDLFTEEWFAFGKDAGDGRGVFRGGFGCTAAGRFLREHATELGFVMPYPIHPDDRHPQQPCVPRWDIVTGINPRTGYRHEHWHLRFIGKDNARRFEAAWRASEPGSPKELALEQWLRAEQGLGPAEVDLPVCDGCNCGTCATLAPPGKHACDRQGGALHLGDDGRPVAAEVDPQLEGARRLAPARGSDAGAGHEVIEVTVHVPTGTITQTPLIGAEGASYAVGASYQQLAPYPGTQPRGYPVLESAWMVALEPAGGSLVPWPYRAALADAAHGRIYNKTNVLLPARTGAVRVRVGVPAGALRVTLLQAGVARGAELSVP